SCSAGRSMPKTHSRMGSSSMRPTSKASGSGAASAPSPPGMSGHVTFYVEVPDIEAELVQAEKLGGTRIMGPSEVQPGVQLGQFNDPEGHMVGLLKGPA